MGSEIDPGRLVDATERLYRSLFAAALAFAVGTVAWGLVIAPFNGYNDHVQRSVVLGVVLLVVNASAFYFRRDVFRLLRRYHTWLLLAVILSVAALWIDGGWRSSFYLASYSTIAVAAVVANLRWSLLCGLALAIGYVLGLLINGYTWEELKALNDADSIIANTGGYLIAAYFFSAPVQWLGGYVARINRVLVHEQDEPEDRSGMEPDSTTAVRSRERLKTAALTPMEVEVVQLVSAGKTAAEIGSEIHKSPRTVEGQIQSAIRKTGARRRTDLVAIAVSEGIVPELPEDRDETQE